MSETAIHALKLAVQDFDKKRRGFIRPSTTGVDYPISFQKEDTDSLSLSAKSKPLTIDDLGWTKEKAMEARARLSHFIEDWEDPSMDAYDDL